MKQFGLIGFPLTHSFSEKYFTEKFAREGISGCVYNTFPLEDLRAFPDFISAHPELCGLNVTIPHKEKIIPYLDELDPVAKQVGAVNCIHIGADKKKKGYNTDVQGFRQSIKPFLERHHEKALILGTGGASKAVSFVLNEIGIDCFFVRREKKENEPKTFEYKELNQYVMQAFMLIINTTPVGTFPNVDARPDIPYHLLTPSHFLYDLVYNPAETAFLKEGKEHGCATMNGESMLRLQAEESWKIWTK